MQPHTRIFRVRVNQHNNLEAFARYQVSVVKSKLAGGDTEGLQNDCMSAVIAMAFAVEAILNYVGAKKIPNWKERASFKTKISLIERACQFKFDSSAEPFRTLELVKRSRDTMAHGQPIEFCVSVSTDQEIAKHMKPTWKLETQPVVVIVSFEQVETFKEFLFSRAGIKPGAALTSAASP